MQQAVIKANIVVFIASFCTLVIELVAGRILAPYLGVSLYTWTSIIGVVLAGISIGAYLGGLLADRFPRQATLGFLLLLSGVGAFSIVPLTDQLGNFQLHSSLMLRILTVTTMIFFIPSCLLGMISPVVVKLTLDNLDKTGNVVGKIYAFSTLGSILGTFATGFFLISWMGTRLILFSIGAVLLLSGLLFGGFFQHKKLLALLLAPCAATVLSFYAYGFKPLGDDPLIYLSKESNYYTIQLRLAHSERKGGRVEAMVLDHLTHSFTDLSDPLHLEYEYIRLYEELVRWQVKDKPSFRAMFIGGGGYTFPRFLHERYPGAQMDVVEIDPEVTRIAEEHLGSPRNSRIRTFNQDARWFVMNTEEKGQYDFIFGDAFNDLSVPYHLTTREFGALLKKRLKPDGLLMANLIDSYDNGLFLPSYIRTLEEVFGRGNVHVVTIYKEYGEVRTGTFVVLAGRQPLDIEGFLRAGKEENGESGWLGNIIPQEVMQAYLQTRPHLILTDDYVPVDNLLARVFEERYGYRSEK